MKRIAVLMTVLFISLAAVWTCSKNDLTEQQVFNIIKTDSMIAKNDDLALKSVSILSSTWMDDKFKALLQIDFFNDQDAFKWRKQGEKDFIPAGMEVSKGMNTVKVTAIFSISYAGDGSWFIDQFIY